jgi:hypothetical protein
MPSYQNVTPPISLMPGDVGFSFNNETFPGSAQAGSQFAIPSYAGQPDCGTAVRPRRQMVPHRRRRRRCCRQGRSLIRFSQFLHNS